MVIGPERPGAVPDPVLAFGGGKRVEVEQHLPVGLRLPEALHRRPPPQPLRVRRVDPVVVEEPPPPGDEGQLVGPVHDGGQRVAIGGEAPIAEPPHRRRALFCHPGERTLPFDLLQPQERIVIGRGERRLHGQFLLPTAHNIGPAAPTSNPLPTLFLRPPGGRHTRKKGAGGGAPRASFAPARQALGSHHDIAPPRQRPAVAPSAPGGRNGAPGRCLGQQAALCGTGRLRLLRSRGLARVTALRRRLPTRVAARCGDGHPPHAAGCLACRCDEPLGRSSAGSLHAAAPPLLRSPVAKELTRSWSR